MNINEQIVGYLKRIESRQIKDSSPWYTINEASAYLKTSVRSLRRYIKNGNIKSHKTPTGAIRFHRSDLDSFIMFGKSFSKLTRPQKEELISSRD